MVIESIRVLILSHFYPTPTDSSPGVFFHEQAKQLQAQGTQVIVIAPVPWFPKDLYIKSKWRNYADIPLYAEIDGILVYYPRYFRPPGAWFRAWSGISMYIGLKRLVDQLHQHTNFDLINSHALFPAGHTGLLLGQRLNLPTVCVLHGRDTFVLPFENKYTRRVSMQIICQTDQLIVVSKALKKAAEALAKPKHPVHVVYNGVDTQRFRPDNPEIARKKLALPLNAPLILFIGTGLKHKGLYDLLAVQDLIQQSYPTSKLVVVGANMEQIYASNPTLTERAKSWLIAAGVRPSAEIPTWINACDLLVLPSHSEGLGCVLLEAAACERPTVGTRVQGIQEAIQDGVTGVLVDQDKPIDLAKAIIELLDNPERRAQMGQAGRQRIITQFQWTHNAQHTINLYRELLS
jgi:glycosyltransferase involved in cell wall biosynthesis